MIQINCTSRYAGYYKFEVRKARTNEITYESEWIKNLITDIGLNGIGTHGTVVSNPPMYIKCVVGTGNTPPTVGDSQLQSLVATANLFTAQAPIFVDGTIPYYSTTATYQFATGAAAGNLAEVGILTESNELFSRALILDGNGAPTTITVLSDEILTVTYEGRQYIDKSDTPYTMNISGVDYTGVFRWCLIFTALDPLAPMGSSYNNNDNSVTLGNGTIGPITGQPANTLSAVVVGVKTPYVQGNLYMDITYTFGVNDANFPTGISCMVFGTRKHRYQFSISPSIPKVLGQTLQLSVRCSWGRYP